ncbi:MAG: aminotransferase class V-fold PLP-dependent enzyme [Bacteroidetes bacterium]|nr:aminotransferase class V-fold PLP-dependent enzyme [Bacteroidota bacterium]
MLKNQKHLFTLEEGVTYLNCAYMSPLLKSVEEAGVQGIIRKRSPFSIQVEDFFEPVQKLREVFSQLIQNPDPNRIALIPAASYGLSTVAANLKLNAGDNIIVVHEQFPSNIYPWENVVRESGAELRTISPPESIFPKGETWNEKILEGIDERTRMVAIAHFHWADGTRFDLKEIRRKTREVGALMVVDGTQSVGAYPFSVQEYEPDALICAGYKWLMGPYSLGLAYFGPYFDDKKPLEENWINRLGSEDFSQLVNYESRYQPLAGRFNVGEQSNFILVPMLTRAIEQILEWGVENIQEYCGHLIEKPIKTWTEWGCEIEAREWRGNHLLGVRLPGRIDIKQLKRALDEANISVSVRGTAVRISPHLYNDSSDFVKTLSVFQGFFDKIAN